MKQKVSLNAAKFYSADTICQEKTILKMKTKDTTAPNHLITVHSKIIRNQNQATTNRL